jgi:hypothetical protein
MATHIGTDAPFDVTIAGAGIAGLYTAWRLVSSAAQQSPLLRELAQKNGTGQLRICFLEETDLAAGSIRIASTSPVKSWISNSVACATTRATSVWSR